VCANNSYSDLGYQGGYLYTSALASGVGGRTVIRYDIAGNTWQIWKDASNNDINLSSTTGNGLFMDPTASGVGYSSYAASSYWVKFDWNAKTASNTWMTTAGLGVTDANWVSVNEDSALSGGGVYYATKNDKAAGLSGGDVIYTWSGLGSPIPSVLTQKPWQAGCGQSIEFIPESVSPSGRSELWLVRGADGSSNPGNGTGNATTDWARLDSTDVASGWATGTLPGTVGYTGEIVLIQGCVFVRGQGTSWYVTKLR
jgi:hypothetical protein